MDDADLTRDAFLGGRLSLWQPRQGYRAGVDPVFLAASVVARPGDSLLDLGCGVGTAALCAGVRLPGLLLTGLERQDDHAALARRNAADAGIDMIVETGDLSDMPAALRQKQFDHVIANPPYFLRGASHAANTPAREAARGEDTPLDDWVKAAARRVRQGGSVCFIHRAERLAELSTSFDKYLGSLEIKPLIPRRGRDAQLVLIRGRKGGRAGLRLHDGLLIHAGASHGGDGADYTPEAEAILRHGAALNFQSCT